MRQALILILAVFLLSGCSSIKNMIKEGDDAAPLTGERIPYLQIDGGLQASPALLETPMTLPDPWTNQFWPQAGGYPNHTMGHVTLGPSPKRIWSTSIGAGGGRRQPLTVRPIAAEGLVFTMDSEGVVAAFDVNTGKEKWDHEVIPRGESDSGAIGGGLAYASGKLFVTNGYKQLVALDPMTGAVAWKAATPSPARSAPTIVDDRIYVVTLDNHLFVFSVNDGTPLWDYASVSETTNMLGAASVAADSSVVVLPLSSGAVFGLRPENGQIVWEDNLGAVRHTGVLSAIADIRGLPVIDQGVVFAVSYSGRLVALDPVTGQRLWQREVGSGETPWSAGDYIFMITTDQQLVAFARKDGDVRWVTQLAQYEDNDKQDPLVWTGPVLAGGRLIVAGSNRAMLEVDPGTGKILSTTKTEGPVMLPPIVVENTLLLLTADGELAAYR